MLRCKLAGSALLIVALACSSCWVPPRRYGLREDGARRTPPLPRWSRPPTYTIAGSDSTEKTQGFGLPDPLSLREAFLLALQSNKAVRVSDLGAMAEREAISGAKGDFDVVSFAEVSRGRSTLPVAGIPLTEIDQSEGFVEAGLRQRTVTGTDVELSAANTYLRDLNGVAVLNPLYGPEARLSVTQDLLRDFGVGVNRTFVSVAENGYEAAREDLRNTTIQTLFEVESAYWDLFFALADLKVRGQRLERAQRLVEVAQAQVDVGISAPLDVVRAKSSAAAQESEILNAHNRIVQLRNRLLRAMGVIDQELTNPEFMLSDAPTPDLYQPARQAAIQQALEYRPAYRQALLEVDTRDLLRRFFKNQQLPDLEFFADYLLTGLGDDFGDASDELTDGRWNAWTVGLRFEFPIPNRTARSEYQVARLRHQQALWRWQSVHEQIVREVSDALSDLRTAAERIETARRARELAAEVLRAEERSFTLGRSDSLDVLEAQAALAAAERDEVRAGADYEIALANLSRVQGTLLERKGVRVAAERTD